MTLLLPDRSLLEVVHTSKIGEPARGGPDSQQDCSALGLFGNDDLGFLQELLERGEFDQPQGVSMTPTSLQPVGLLSPIPLKELQAAALLKSPATQAAEGGCKNSGVQRQAGGSATAGEAERNNGFCLGESESEDMDLEMKRVLDPMGVMTNDISCTDSTLQRMTARDLMVCLGQMAARLGCSDESGLPEGFDAADLERRPAAASLLVAPLHHSAPIARVQEQAEPTLETEEALDDESDDDEEVNDDATIEEIMAMATSGYSSSPASPLQAPAPASAHPEAAYQAEKTPQQQPHSPPPVTKTPPPTAPPQCTPSAVAAVQPAVQLPKRTPFVSVAMQTVQQGAGEDADGAADNIAASVAAKALLLMTPKSPLPLACAQALSPAGRRMMAGLLLSPGLDMNWEELGELQLCDCEDGSKLTGKLAVNSGLVLPIPIVCCDAAVGPSRPTSSRKRPAPDDDEFDYAPITPLRMAPALRKLINTQAALNGIQRALASLVEDEEVLPPAITLDGSAHDDSKAETSESSMHFIPTAATTHLPHWQASNAEPAVLHKAHITTSMRDAVDALMADAGPAAGQHGSALALNGMGSLQRLQSTIKPEPATFDGGASRAGRRRCMSLRARSMYALEDFEELPSRKASSWPASGADQALKKPSMFADFEVTPGTAAAAHSACNSSGDGWASDDGDGNSAENRRRKQRGDVKFINLKYLEDGGYFDKPIQEAAAELDVGVTTLKKICRSNGISRWPFRKRNSIDKLIEKTRQYMQDGDEGPKGQTALTLDTLQYQRQLLQENQEQDLTQDVKQFRQQVFKLNYKLKKRCRPAQMRSLALSLRAAAMQRVVPP